MVPSRQRQGMSLDLGTDARENRGDLECGEEQ
jgi:hypothetical protein